MKDIFQNLAKQNFMMILENFLESISESWPNCEECDNIVKTVLNMKQNNKEDEIIDFWSEMINKNLHKKVKYSKALERILKETGGGIIYHICEYNDFESLEITLSDNEDWKKLQLSEKYHSLTDENKKILWKYVHELNIKCFEALGKNIPVVPTRKEIQMNIKSKKSITEDAPSMSKAFQNTLSTLCSDLQIPDISQNLSEDNLQSLVSRWATFSQDSIEGQKITVLCNQKNAIVIPTLVQIFDEFKILLDQEISENIWQSIIQLNGYATVGENIPVKMMGKIENLASKLADDIVNGRTDMSNLNLSDIGQQVLSQCDESDMNNFANNIENLLPALQSFQTNMK